MKTGAAAEAYFKNDNNCAQSVLKALKDYTGLSDDLADTVSFGFGGGVRCREICGAITGGVIAVNCALYHADREKTIANSKEFVNCCKEKFGWVRCEQLKKVTSAPARNMSFLRQK